MKLQVLKDWIKRHPQLALSFVQVTCAQMQTWDWMPQMAIGIVQSIVALVQAWFALYYSNKDKPQTEDQSKGG